MAKVSKSSGGVSWKLLFWVLGVITTLPLVGGVIVTALLANMAQQGAAGTDVWYLVFMVPFGLLSLVSFPALILALCIYLIQNPGGGRKKVAQLSLVLLGVYFVVQVLGFAALLLYSPGLAR